MGILDGKTAVVTGSTRGLGLAIAEAYAREGAAVMLCGRSQETLQSALSDLQHRGRRATGIVADVGNLADVKRIAEQAVETFGRIDIWVNNAGVAGVYGPTAALDPAVVERGIRTNILGVYYGSIVAIQRFLAQDTGGKLINILGRGDHKPVPLQNAYAPTKAWVYSFTDALAREYRDERIGVYMLNPGLMDTELMREITVIQGFEEKVKPLATVMRLWANPPATPAEKAVWLASPATDRKTGRESRALTAAGIAGGLWRYATRWLLRRPVPEITLDIHSVAPYRVMGRAPAEAEV
jgi:NAD(P)-dependent dehydrogenase (short-subunit alcohol dehydrogenase family)